MSALAVAQRARAIRDRADGTTILAFLLAVGLGGLSTVFVRVTLHELPPMWGGTLRFTTGALILTAIVVVRGIPRPRGKALAGAIMFGALGMGLSTILIYRGLVDTPAGVSQVILALVPLETFLFAVALRLERFRAAGLVGAGIAVVGVAVVFSHELSSNVPLGGLLSILAAGVAISSTTVVLKWFPASQALSAASVALPIGAGMFFIASLLFGEAHPLPQSLNVWLSMAWLVLVGTLAVMTLFLFVITRLSASTASYQFLLLPLVTVIASSVVDGEQIAVEFLLGAAVVLAGVYVGIIRPARSSPSAAVLTPAIAPATVE